MLTFKKMDFLCNIFKTTNIIHLFSSLKFKTEHIDKISVEEVAFQENVASSIYSSSSL